MNGTLLSQALIVTEGPFQGRICLNDDDEIIWEEEFDDFDQAWYDPDEVEWVSFEDDAGGEPSLGLPCEVVTFGDYLLCRGHYFIPRQFLSPATMRDLVVRLSDIIEEITRSQWLQDYKPSLSLDELLLELLFIQGEIREREMKVEKNKSVTRNIFLCHSSVDKPFVRTVANDLALAGHNIWLDEFEIKVGDSIVQKISDATESIEFLALFVSTNSVNSPWVQREWHSVAMRSISKGKINILPIVIEEVELPPLLSDIKYADFKNSYRDGLDQLLQALSRQD